MTNRTVSSSSRNGRARRALGVSACVFAFLGGLAGFGGEKTALAQEWLKDRREQEGAGIRVGNLELHPGIGGEVGYDSNYFLRSYKTSGTAVQFVNADPTAPPVETGVLRITPSFTISTLNAQRQEGPTTPAPVAFRGGVSATYREFLSGNSEIRDQRNLSANAFGRLDVFPGRPLGFGVFANYTRLIQPSVVFNPDLSFNQDDVIAGAEVIALPGGGTFDIRAGYQFQASIYEEKNGVPFTNFTHELSLRNRWKFRPRTALFHDTTLRFIDYPNADRALNFLDGSTPLRTRIGLTGLLTERFGVLLAVGYGATFFKRPTLGQATSQYDSMNAQAEGTIYLSKPDSGGEPGQASLLLSKLVFGYSRDFSNSLLANYYTSNKGYARMEYFFAGRALITLEGYFEALSYPQPFYQQNGTPVAVHGADGALTGDFTNFHVGGTLYGEYRFTDAFALTATLDYSQTISDVALETSANPTNAPVTSAYDLSWRRVQALLGARFFF